MSGFVASHLQAHYFSVASANRAKNNQNNEHANGVHSVFSFNETQWLAPVTLKRER